MEFMMIRMAKEVESIFDKSKSFQGLMTKPLVKVDDFVLLKFYTIAFAVCVPQLRQVVWYMYKVVNFSVPNVTVPAAPVKPMQKKRNKHHSLEKHTKSQQIFGKILTFTRLW